MKNQFFLLTLCFAIFGTSSCSKNDTEDLRPSCEVNEVGGIRVESYQDEAFGIYINDGYKGVVGAYGSLQLDNISRGTYTFKAKEIDYVFVQDVYNASVTVTQCQTQTVNF